MTEYLFKCKTNEGHILKIINELIQCIKNGCIHFGQDGISIDGADTKTKKGSMMISIFLPRNKFTKYKITEEVTARINFVHLYNLTRTIRKKDTAILYITKEDPYKLVIKKLSVGEDESKALENSISITSTQRSHLKPPDLYNDPIVVNSKEFQKLKSLSKISKLMKVSFKNGKISFSCDKGVYSGKVPFGETNSEDSDVEEDDEDEEECIQTYNSDYIIDLVKLGSTSKFIQIYTQPDFPLKFTIEPPLGCANIYIKSNEILEEEEKEGDGNVGGGMDTLII